MAESETTVATVSVFEGPYIILNKFGVPLPVCLVQSELEANVTVSKKNRKRKKERQELKL